MKILTRIAALSMGPLLLAGCESVDSLSKDAEAPVTEQGDSQPGEAKTQGVEDAGAFQGSPLGAPGAMERGSAGSSPADGSASGRVIYFDYDRDEIRPEFRHIIESLVNYLANHPNTVVTLEGHTDERGSREYNLALGEKRALAVDRQIGLMGADAGHARTVSYGEERPAALGHDEHSYGLNRRVEIIY
ncbi:MAG TPA: OmpA family protein [Gammaproteobacteria bacterium]|nr:OmpA family protein [Gammaproteobacteria bacterium]